jgi:hypothetical protein
MTTVKAVIPFNGLYESMHDAELDRAFEGLYQDSQTGDCIASLHNLVWDHVNWQKVHEAYAKAFAENFAAHFEIEGMVFESLVSPREYNFTTDRIFVDVPLASLKALNVPRDVLDAVAAEMFTSRSGFCSFYSPDVDTWGEIEDWDHNQLLALITAHVRHVEGEDFDEFCLMEDMNCNGQLDEMLWDAIDTDHPDVVRANKIYTYLRNRDDRKWS